MVIFTVGYGGRKVDDFVALLRENGISHLVDVRSRPFGMFPEYSRPTLESVSATWAIKYIFLGDDLGGKPECPECYDKDGMVQYNLVAEQGFFQRGIQRLMREAETPGQTVCLMCAERKPSDCHRAQLIGEELLRRGTDVLHIIERGEVRSQHAVMKDQPSLFQ